MRLQRCVPALFGIALVCISVAAASLPKVAGISVEGPMGYVLAPRDTLQYTLRWGKSIQRNETSYQVTVTAVATPSGVGIPLTTGLPVKAVVPDSIIAFQAVNLQWDSIVFTATVTAYRGTVPSKLSSTKTWTIAKLPGNPGPIIVDSSAIPPVAFNGLEIQVGTGDHRFPWAPLPVQTVGNQSAMTACAYMLFSNGTVVMRTQDDRYCRYNYRTGYAAARRSVCTPQTPQWSAGTLVRGDFVCQPLPNAVVQAWADAHCIDYMSTNPLAVRLDPPVACPNGGVNAVAVYPAGISGIVASIPGVASATRYVGWSVQ
jgi:hypothetical protein